MSAGVGGTNGPHGDPIASGTSTVRSFGSSRHADSGLPDTPMSAAGSSHNPRLTQQVGQHHLACLSFSSAVPRHGPCTRWPLAHDYPHALICMQGGVGLEDTFVQ